MSSAVHPLPPAVPGAPTSISVDDWTKVLQSVDGCDKERLNALVMNWLIVQGYQTVAEEFQGETATPASVPLSSIAARTAVRSSLSSGAISTALQQIEALAPNLLQTHPQLYLALQQQHLVELIRANDIEGALTFARTHLRDGCANEVEFLTQMESIMSLLAFSALPAEQNPMRHLLDQARRNKLGNEVNEKILEGQLACKESQLSLIIKQLHHSQNALKQYMPQFPALDCSSVVSDASASAPSSSPSSTSTSALLDPSSVFESLAHREHLERLAREKEEARKAEERRAAEEQERQAKQIRDQARRQRRIEQQERRAREPRSMFRQDIPSAAEEEEEQDEEEEEQGAEEEPDEEMST
jgi:hypothetical protein